jgi:predicted urease superfamily metal-dependent hydrolase
MTNNRFGHVYTSTWACDKCNKIINITVSKSSSLKIKLHKKMCDKNEAMTLEEYTKRNKELFENKFINHYHLPN